MRKKILCLLVINGCFMTMAYTQSEVIAVARYMFRHISDTTQPDNPDEAEQVLILAPNKSMYMDQEKVAYNKRAEEAKLKYPGLKYLTYKWGNPHTLYQGIENGTIVAESRLNGNDYAIHEIVEPVNWKITGEIKEIKGYKSQKATGSFRGREYEAWFCSALPFQSGPWKFQGLPGLITEVYDTKREVVFSLLSFTDTSWSDMKVMLPEGAIKTTYGELKKVMDALDLNKNALSGNAGGTAVVANVSGIPAETARKKKILNNPIEKTSGSR